MSTKGIQRGIVHTGQKLGGYFFAFRAFDFKGPDLLGPGLQLIAKAHGLDVELGFRIGNGNRNGTGFKRIEGRKMIVDGKPAHILAGDGNGEGLRIVLERNDTGIDSFTGFFNGNRDI